MKNIIYAFVFVCFTHMVTAQSDWMLVEAPPGVDALRVRVSNTATKLRVFENGAISLNSNWSNPSANCTYIAGNLGVNTTPNPSSSNTALRVDGNTSIVNGSADSEISLNSLGIPFIANGAFIQLKNAVDEPTVKIYSDVLGQGAGVIQMSNSDANDDSIIELNTNYNNTGVARIITDELEIRGGADFAENFDVNTEEKKVLPGMVVSIDPDSKGRLMLSQTAYDRKVAGIVSGANGVETGLYMSQKGSVADGDYPIALMGRVYVYANDEGGEIAPGDFLTSSSVPGFAMKASDHTQSKGAIIGKAMTEKDENGFILVLVNLQ